MLHREFMKIAQNWTDYSIIATGDGYKLERWKDVYLLRPDPQVIWSARADLFSYPELNAFYKRSESGGGGWKFLKPMPAEWEISYEKLGLRFKIKPMGFKHTGLFPEQAVNWDYMSKLIRGANRSIKVLNLFAYTGGATVACAKAGAQVTHVDAAKGMVERAGMITNRIKEYRARFDLKQEELARRVGVRRETIGNLEKGRYNPSLVLAWNIAKVFGVPIEEIFTVEGDV